MELIKAFPTEESGASIVDEFALTVDAGKERLIFPAIATFCALPLIASMQGQDRSATMMLSPLSPFL